MSSRISPGPDVTVVSRVVLDEFREPAGGSRLELGGSGFWAAYGAAIVADEVAIACRVGREFRPGAGPWRARLAALGIRDDALVDSPEPASRTLIEYPPDGDRVETPLPSWDAQLRMRTLLDEIPAPADRPRGWYVFRELHPGFWPPLLDRVAETGAPLLWELPPTLCGGPPDAAMRAILRRTDILSLNRSEAAGLLGAGPAATGDEPLDGMLDRLLEFGPGVVVLRLGARGSAVASEAGRVRCSSAAVEAVDVTGAGNAFSGAFLAAVLAGNDLAAATVRATAAAATAVEQVGHPPDRASARARARVLAATIRVTGPVERGAGHQRADHQSADHQRADHQSADHQSADHQRADHQSTRRESADRESAERQSAGHVSADHQSTGHESAGHESTGGAA